jgi:hypothetical protein
MYTVHWETFQEFLNLTEYAGTEFAFLTVDSDKPAILLMGNKEHDIVQVLNDEVEIMDNEDPVREFMCTLLSNEPIDNGSGIYRWDNIRVAY